MMTVEKIAMELQLWEMICSVVGSYAGQEAASLLDRLAVIPVRRSKALRSLGSYVTRHGMPVCIRLQFSQEPETLRQTFLHEVAHACDHLNAERKRQAHGPGWQAWMVAFGELPERCGKSEALNELHRQRLKLVAVCERCGADFYRLRRLSRKRDYLHSGCGGRLRKW